MKVAASRCEERTRAACITVHAARASAETAGALHIRPCINAKPMATTS